MNTKAPLEPAHASAQLALRFETLRKELRMSRERFRIFVAKRLGASVAVALLGKRRKPARRQKSSSAAK